MVKGPIGPVGIAKEATDPLSAWKLFFDQRMIALIVTETNNEIQRVRDSLPPDFVNSPKVTYLHDTTISEIYALFGLMYYRGAFGQGMHNVDIVFSEKYGHPVFSATMSRNRFKFLRSKIRFDNREERKRNFKSNRFAAFR